MLLEASSCRLRVPCLNCMRRMWLLQVTSPRLNLLKASSTQQQLLAAPSTTRRSEPYHCLRAPLCWHVLCAGTCCVLWSRECFVFLLSPIDYWLLRQLKARVQGMYVTLAPAAAWSHAMRCMNFRLE